ncbi:restriction endonuclease [Enemella evansiae]|uniref:Restriction endonuclease n=1 Tax=Enemella evansiae TaxID=2016499 RepID=A0A255GIX1_9ACTN|nr:restriction endonuclease [Enemella evansiae]OYO12934.1 restriction endonuclease [Enemella evansiae]
MLRCVSASDPVRFEDLATSDLQVDRVYRGGSRGNVGDEPIARIIPGVGNQGGFRSLGSISRGDVRLVVLYTSGEDTNWPDTLDPVTGDFTYYGDNKKPGAALHDTPRRGNLLLREVFQLTHGGPGDRLQVPPFLLFEKGAQGRDVIFRGLLAPGSSRLTAEEELVAVWRTTRDKRFQNYRSHFTVLNVASVTRSWLTEIANGNINGPHAPKAWTRWVRGRVYDALEAKRTVKVRSKEDQYPNAAGLHLLKIIHEHFEARPVAFEHLAARIWLQADKNVDSVDVTRPSRDGGRDGIGQYLVGPRADPVRIEFALEAKCYKPQTNSVGVREMSRLISRIKHRDFGVMVTTAHVGDQVYKEVREDGHPIVIIAGRDIVEVLSQMGIRTPEELRTYLAENFDEPRDETVSLADLVEPSVPVEVASAHERARPEQAVNGGSPPTESMRHSENGTV